MADLTENQAAAMTKVIGSDSSGQEQTPIQSTAAGALHINLRDSSGVEEGTPTNPLNVAPSQDSVIITTAAALGANAAFTSATIDLNTFSGAEITVGVFANVASAALGMQLQWSLDGTNFDIVESYSIPAMTAGQGKTFTQRKVARYLRIVYTNGVTLQTTFRLTAYLNVQSAKPSSHRLGTIVDDDNDAQLTKASLIARRKDGSGNNSLRSTTNDDLGVVDLCDEGGVQGVIAVGLTPVAVRVGVANLANRKRLLFINTGSVNLYWGFSNTVSSANGMIIYRNQPVSDSWGPNTTIWIVAGAGSGGVSVAESA